MEKRETEAAVDMMLTNHLRKLFNEHEKLQLEYARLQKQFMTTKINLKIDHSSLSNYHNDKPEEDIRRELEREKLLCKSLATDNDRLTKEVKSMAGKYSELLTIFNAHKDTVVENERLKRYEEEIKELKEMLDFANAEKDVLKDIEEQAFRERLEWMEEKKKYEELVVWSKRLKVELKESVLKNDNYEKIIASCSQLLDTLLNSYFKLPTEQNVIENNNSDGDNDLEKKIQRIQQCIKSKKSNDENSNVLQQNNNGETETYKKKLSELSRENGSLKETNRCLMSEVTELKNILNKNNIPSGDIDLKLENAKLTESLKNKEEMLENLKEKYNRHRAVLEDNYKRSTEEIKALDNFISLIIEKLNSLPTDLRTAPILGEIIQMINETEAATPPHKP